MKKIILIMASLLLYGYSFSQTATINDCHGDSYTDCLLSVCSGSVLDSLTAGDSDGGIIISYTWKLNEHDGVNWSGLHTVSNDPVIVMPSVYGHTYDYQLIINVGGSYVQSFARLSVSSLPVSVLSSNNNIICFGEIVDFTVTGGSTYDFHIISGGVDLSVQSSAASTISKSDLIDGDQIYVVVTNASGCEAISNTITMTVHSLPDATDIIGRDACNNSGGMDFEYVDLTGSGDWTVQFWNSAHTIQYGSDYSTTIANGLFLGVDIPFGTSDIDVKIIDNGTMCPNF